MKFKKIKLNDSIKFNIVAIFLIIIFCIAISPVAFQNDTFYTIKIGEHIKNYGIDMKDPFSWHEGLPYTYPHWLYDLITYFIYSAFGFMGIYVTTIVLTCILGVTIYRVNCKLSKSNIVSFLITIGAMYLLKPFIAARAQLVTFILFALTIYFIEMFIQKKKLKYAIALIIIPILIANLHCAVWPFYFVLYLPYVAEYIIALVSDFIINKKFKVKRKHREKDAYKIVVKRNKNVKWLIIIMIICAFTGLLTPLGTTPYTYLSKTMEGNTTENINEHLPMTIADQQEALCTVIIFLSILTFTKTKIRLSDLFLVGGLCYLMLSSRRQLSMFAVLGSIVLTRLIVSLIREYEPRKGTLKRLTKFAVTRVGLIILIVSMSGLSYYFCKRTPKKYVETRFVNEKDYPVQACDYILENIDLGKARFYNEYNYGSYMLFRNIPVFIDSRADLYAPEFSGLEDDIFMDFIETSNISKFYEDVFEKYKITHVITYKNSKTNMIITKTHDNNYKEIYSDSYFVIYERLNANVEENN